MSGTEKSPPTLRALFGWGAPPEWASQLMRAVKSMNTVVVDIHQMVSESLQNEVRIMATEVEVETALDQLVTVVDEAVTEIKALKSQGDGGATAAQLDGLLAKISGARDAATAALTPPTPPAPVTGP